MRVPERRSEFWAGAPPSRFLIRWRRRAGAGSCVADKFVGGFAENRGARLLPYIDNSWRREIHPSGQGWNLPGAIQVSQESIGEILGFEPAAADKRQPNSAAWAEQALAQQMRLPLQVHAEEKKPVLPDGAHAGAAAGRHAPNQNGDGGKAESHVVWHNWGGNLDPYLRALSGRVAYQGAMGTLFSTESSWKKSLTGAGPVGEQILERMAGLEAKGWSFGSLGMGDPFWDLTNKGKFARVARMFTLGGYHWDMHDGQPVKRIAINHKIVALSNLIGGSYGGATTPKDFATLMAHEVSHEDGILREHPGDWRTLPLEEQRILAKRMLATETRAILTQLHVAGEMGSETLTNARFRAALQSGKLGGFIHETWSKSGETYGSFKTITAKEAEEFVNKYIEETFGKDLYNRTTGKVRAFDINAGLDRQIGTITGDAELAESMKVVRPGLRPAENSMVKFFSENRGGSALLRGGQALGAVGLMVAVNDVGGAFNTSAGTGVGRLGRVGVDWAGFELGTAGGAWVGRGMAVMLAERCVSTRALPFLIMGGGMLGSHLIDSAAGRKVEKFLCESVDSGVKRLKQLFS